MTNTQLAQHRSRRHDTEFGPWFGTGMGGLRLETQLSKGKDTRSCLDIGKAG